MKKWYRFDEGLSQIERLEVLIDSPLLKLVAPRLPAHGTRTKPALADPAALLVVGAATVIFGSDRRADTELRAHWPHLRERLVSAGYRVPASPLRARHFRDYRDKVLGGSLPEEVKEELRDLAANVAIELGLFPNVDSPWAQPEPGQVVVADGSWWAAASKVRTVEESRSKLGIPRVVADADPHNKHSWGYNFCFLSVRGEHPRQRVMLDIVHAEGQREMEVVVPAVLRLRARVGDRFRWFVYDGAMRGVHQELLRPAGILALNKPPGTRQKDQWRKHQRTKLAKTTAIFDLGVECATRHLFTVTAGLLWDVEVRQGLTSPELFRCRVLDVNEVRRLSGGDGTYRWELVCTVRCDRGDHQVVVDPGATLRGTSAQQFIKNPDGPARGRCRINLSEKLRVVQVNSEEFWRIYGARNDIEAGNKTMKFDFGLGTRAGSFRVGAHEMDLWIFMLLANSLALREHIQRGRRRRLARPDRSARAA